MSKLRPRGRHPLQEQVVDTFVPNDTRVVGGSGTDSSFNDNDNASNSDGDWNSVVLCTGANACGKVSQLNAILFQFSSPFQSVYLKQVRYQTQNKRRDIIQTKNS
jgi:Mismatch repair ATPase (MutS family)